MPAEELAMVDERESVGVTLVMEDTAGEEIEEEEEEVGGCLW